MPYCLRAAQELCKDHHFYWYYIFRTFLCKSFDLIKDLHQKLLRQMRVFWQVIDHISMSIFPYCLFLIKAPSRRIHMNIYCYFLLGFISESLGIYSSFRTRGPGQNYKRTLCEIFVDKYEKKLGTRPLKYLNRQMGQQMGFLIKCQLLILQYIVMKTLQRKPRLLDSFLYFDDN